MVCMVTGICFLECFPPLLMTERHFSILSNKSQHDMEVHIVFHSVLCISSLALIKSALAYIVPYCPSVPARLRQ